MASLTRAAALAARPKSITVPTPYGDATVVGLTATQRCELFDTCRSRSGDGLNSIASAKVAVWCARTEGGEPLYTDDDFLQVLHSDNALIEPIFQAALQLSGLGATAVEEAKKN